MQIPQNFLWGVATSSYQIEGAVNADGRGQTIWDTFSHTPGKVERDEHGDVACDHYHRYAEDVALMASLGVKAYRFSVAWSRILPTGTGKVNPAGLDFYSRLVDKLLEANIQPFLTLYHWDLPQKLQDRGGWGNRETIEAFVNYTDVVSRKLGDRVKQWITHNEPWVVAFLGNIIGVHAPGFQGDWGLGLQVAHNLLVSHGRAVQVIRQNVPAAQAGIVLNCSHIYPATDSEADQQAARQEDGFTNRWFLDPLYKGEYPADMWARFEDHVPRIYGDDMQQITTPTDFLGINVYTRSLVRANPDTEFKIEHVRTDNEYTEMGWEVYPDGVYDLLMRIHKDYAPAALYITENGAAFNDVVTPDGQVQDTRRQAYYEGHIAAALRSAADGVPLKGYFAWSFLDNFEWSFGYSKRFGIIYVDFATQQRIPKQSALWYKNFIAQAK